MVMAHDRRHSVGSCFWRWWLACWHTPLPLLGLLHHPWLWQARHSHAPHGHVFCANTLMFLHLYCIAQRQVMQRHLQHPTQCISICSTRQHWKQHAERSARLGVCRLTVQWPPSAVPLCVTEGERALGRPLLVLWSSHELGELRILPGAKNNLLHYV